MREKRLDPARQARLEEQGFRGLSPAEIADAAPWLRVVPATLLVGVAWGTVAASPRILLALSVLSALGAVLPEHPVDAVYNHGLRFLLAKPPLPRYGGPRRLGLTIAAVWLAIDAGAFLAGAPALGTVLGALFLMGPVVTVTTDFCPASWIHTRLFGRLPAGHGRCRPA